MSDTNPTPATAGQTVTATIFFRLSPAGQKAAVLAGLNAAREQSITGPIDAGNLDLCMIAPDGIVLCVSYRIWATDAPPELARYVDDRNFRWGSNLLHTLGIITPSVQRREDNLEIDAPPASAADLMSEIRSKVDAVKALNREKAERQAEVDRQRNEEAAAKRAAEITRIETELAAGPDAIPGIHYTLEASDHPVAVEIRRRKAAVDRARESAQAALEQAKTDAIAAWVAGCGNELLQQQYDDGLLARKDIVSLMAAEALNAAGLPARCAAPEICESRDCPCCDETVGTIPTEIYARWKAIGPLPEGSSVEFHRVREHLGPLDDDPDAETAGPVEYHAEVTVPSGPFRFTRRIKL